jgi:hypothetical protein
MSQSYKDKRYVNSVREILSSATGDDLKISITDYTVLCSGGLTIELPAADASQTNSSNSRLITQAQMLTN